MPGDWMHIRPFILLLAVCLAVFPGTASASSVIHGDVYDWSTFDKLSNVEVTVNSLPQQVMISKNGSYTFNLDRGSYSIVARYGNNSTDALSAKEDVTIAQDGGDYVLDLILFPSGDFGDLGFVDENITPIATAEPQDTATAQPQQPSIGPGLALLLAGILIILVAGAGVFLWSRRKKPPEKPVEPPAPEPVEPVLPPLPPSASMDVTLPDDLREVIRIIEKNGGRITQLDLRKALPYSEAKVSLMITDLESRGIVKKVKKGRGNVIILNKPE